MAKGLANFHRTYTGTKDITALEKSNNSFFFKLGKLTKKTY